LVNVRRHKRNRDIHTDSWSVLCNASRGNGAEVIKIEHPICGDFTRELGPPFVENQSSLYLSVNRNKKGLALDITKEKGRAILIKLVQKADIFIENLRPDVLKLMGIDYDSICKVNNKIIYCSISAFGEEGPYSKRPGSDTTIQGMGGIMTISGEEGDPPIRLGITPADVTAGIFAEIGILSALFHREKTGEGQKVSISLIDSLIALQGSRIEEYLITGKNPARTGRASPFIYPAEFFETSDGYINISVVSNKFWQRICSLLKLEQLLEDDRFRDPKGRSENRKEIRKILTNIFSQKTTAEWRNLLDKEDIPNGPIYTYSEMFSDPQIIQNEMIVELDHPEFGKLKLVNQPIHFSRTPAFPKSHPPMLGEHTVEILKNLGFSEKEISILRKEKVIS
jgi:crotonobetainyl-CoA:carnitine CoA-transferase CaiB-like acyl-CoA transferase